jgi:hypothetical protein
VANEFFSWRKVKEDLVPPKDIVDGKTVFKDVPNRPDITFANCYSMLFYVRGKDLTNVQQERVAKFGASFSKAEITLVYFKHLSRIMHKLTFTKGFLGFYKNNKEALDSVLGAAISNEEIEKTLNAPDLT